MEIVRAADEDGVTVKDAAPRLLVSADPLRNEIEKARRKLDGLVPDNAKKA